MNRAVAAAANKSERLEVAFTVASINKALIKPKGNTRYIVDSG
jgi:hypothetical protein